MMSSRTLAETVELCGRVGYGAMRLQSGEGDALLRLGEERSVRFVEEAYEVGYRIFDTADAYGPGINERVLGSALAGKSDVIVATKGGFIHQPSGEWQVNGRPEHLRSACEASLRRLGRGQIELYQLHVPDPAVPIEESMGAVLELRQRGLVVECGICNAESSQVAAAARVVDLAAVQNRVNAMYAPSEELLDAARASKAKLLSWFPLEAGSLARPRGVLARIAAEAQISVAQLALACTLSYDDNIVVIPGTADARHLRENMESQSLQSDAITRAVARARAACERLAMMRHGSQERPGQMPQPLYGSRR